MVELLLRALVAGVLQAPVAAGLIEHLAALLACVDGPLDAWHRSAPSQQLPDGLLVALCGRPSLPNALPLGLPVLHQVARRRRPVPSAVHQLALPGQPKPLLRCAVCLLLWHRLFSLPRSSSGSFGGASACPSRSAETASSL